MELGLFGDMELACYEEAFVVDTEYIVDATVRASIGTQVGMRAEYSLQ